MLETSLKLYDATNRKQELVFAKFEQVIGNENSDMQPINYKEVKKELREIKNDNASGAGDTPINLLNHEPDILIETFNNCLLQKARRWKSLWKLQRHKSRWFERNVLWTYA